MVSLKKQCLSEFLCGFLVGFLGLGCLVLLHKSDGTHLVDQYEFSMLFGLAIAFIVIIFNPMSGAQFNPGVTLAMVLTKRQDKKTLVPYWLSQILGWFLGAAFVYGVFYNQIVTIVEKEGGAAAVNLLFCNYNAVPWYSAFIFEILLTALMVIIILASNDPRIVNRPGKALFPLILALYITFGVTFAGPYSGACFNAARDFGPRIFALIWGSANGLDTSAVFGNGYQFLLYIFVPTLGAVIGAFIYDGGISRLFPRQKVRINTKGAINENYIKKGTVIAVRKKSTTTSAKNSEVKAETKKTKE